MHIFGSFQKGFEKIYEEFKANLDSYENALKIAFDGKKDEMNYVNEKITWLKSLKAETEAKFLELKKIIDAKEKEVINLILAKITETIKNHEILTKIEEKIRISIDKIKEILAKPNPIKTKDYEDFFESNIALKKMNSIVKDWFPFTGRMIPKSFAIVPASLMNAVGDIKLEEQALNDYMITTFKSEIIKDTNDYKLLLYWVYETCNYSRIKFELLWRGTTDGFGASIFHLKWDNKGTTLTKILSNKNYIFGGYTTQTWAGTGYCYDQSAFIYSLTNKTKHNKQKSKSSSIDRYPGYGPRFGLNDITICDNCNTSNSSYSNGNHTYELPSNCDNKTYLAGSYNFTVKEIEVYSVIINP